MVQPALIPMVAVLVVAPQLLGGVFPWSVAVICLMAATAGISTSRRIEIISHKRQSAKLLDWMMVLTLAWTIVQSLPLPSGVVAFLVPESAEAWRFNALLYRTPLRSWMPLSLDPGATRLEIAKGSAIVAVFLAARIFAASHQRRRVLKGVAASAVVLALVAFAHKVAGATHVFGLYEPVYAASRLLAPIMNENHLGGFMSLTVPILVGLTMDAETLERRIAWALGAFVCALAGVLSFSRGGILGLGVGAIVFIAVYAARLSSTRESTLRSRTIPLLATGFVVGALVALAFGGDALVRELTYTHNLTSKLEAAEAAVPTIASHPIAGVGRGGFSAAFVGEHGARTRFFYPENLLVQWTSEWGLPIALGLLVMIVWSIIRGFRLRRSHAHLGALAGLVAIGVHDLVDFSLEIAGVSVVAAATLGAVADSAGVRPLFALRKLCLIISILSLVGAAIAASLHQRDVFSLEQAVGEALESEDHTEVRRLVDTGLALHPSEPILALAGAEVAVLEGDESAGRWLNRAQDLAPLWSAPHLLAARWLFSLGKMDQALIEIRESEARQPGSARGTICSLLKTYGDPSIALRAAPPGIDGAKLLDRAAQCLPLGSPVAVAIDDSARARDPHLVGPATRQARRLLAEGRSLDAVELLSGLESRDITAHRLLAEAYMQADDPQSAAHAIAPALSLRKMPSDALRTAATVYVALGDDSQVRMVASRLRGKTGGKAKELAEVELFLGGLYESHKRYAPALRAYEDSNRAFESRRALQAIARVAEAQGNRERALLTYRRLCRLEGGKGADCAAAEQLARPPEAWP